MIGKAACFVLMVNSVVLAAVGVLCLAMLIFTPPSGMLRITLFFTFRDLWDRTGRNEVAVAV